MTPGPLGPRLWGPGAHPSPAMPLATVTPVVYHRLMPTTPTPEEAPMATPTDRPTNPWDTVHAYTRGDLTPWDAADRLGVDLDTLIEMADRYTEDDQ